MAWTDSIARYGKIVWYFRPEVTLPLVCTQGIAEVAATELLSPSSEPHVVREVGAEDLTKPQMGRSYIPRDREARRSGDRSDRQSRH